MYFCYVFSQSFLSLFIIISKASADFLSTIYLIPYLLSSIYKIYDISKIILVFRHKQKNYPLLLDLRTILLRMSPIRGRVRMSWFRRMASHSSFQTISFLSASIHALKL